MRRNLFASAAIAALAMAVLLALFSTSTWAQVGSNNPTDQQLQALRAAEVARGFVIAAPPAGTILKPVLRVPRDKFNAVGAFPLTLKDLDALVYPDATAEERAAVLEGLQFFTTPHTAAEGAGPMANQRFCLGCHMNTAENIANPYLSTANCVAGSPCVSQVSRAARATPTNFFFTGLDPATGGGRPADNLDALHNTGHTAAFTIFGDFSPSLNVFDPLDGAFKNPVTGVAQPFGGFVQHTRPDLPGCLPDPLPSLAEDVNLAGAQDPSTGLWPTGFRRAVSERAAPPYIGRGLMESIPDADLAAFEDPNDTVGSNSSLGSFGASMGCTADCVAGRHNQIPAGTFVGGPGRFGLRANGVEILQFVAGGLQGELGFTSLLNPHEINLANVDLSRATCPADPTPNPDAHLSIPFSIRTLLRITAPPEFGDYLLKVMNADTGGGHMSRVNRADKGGGGGGMDDQKELDMVRRGAELFGVDLTAFANRMIPGRMPASGDDGLDPNAINQADRKLNCVGCHIPVHRTGQSPAEIGASHLSFVWAPIFSDLLLHKGPTIDAERNSPRPRDPLVIARLDFAGAEDKNRKDDPKKGGIFASFDIPRNLSDDAFTGSKGSALGTEFRTPPLMGMGKIGPPFFHDARVYLDVLTRDTEPASTVTTNSRFTNAPLVIRTLEDAIRASIEIHDLPAPDDANTPGMPGAGCPVPPANAASNVNYGPSPKDAICPAYDSAVSQANRSDSREVMRRWHSLSPEDQQAVIEFLKQL